MIVIDIISWIFLAAGSFFSVVGGVGIVRLPEFFSRLHGGGITDTLGAALIVIGLAFQKNGMRAVFFIMSWGIQNRFWSQSGGRRRYWSSPYRKNESLKFEIRFRFRTAVSNSVAVPLS